MYPSRTVPGIQGSSEKDFGEVSSWSFCPSCSSGPIELLPCSSKLPVGAWDRVADLWLSALHFSPNQPKTLRE